MSIYEITSTTVLIEKLRNIVDQIERFNEFEHSLDIIDDLQDDTYANFMAMIDNTINRWEDHVTKMIEEIKTEMESE